MWVGVSNVEDFEEGRALTAETGSGPVAVFRSRGVYHAVAAVCPHRGGPLAEGQIEEGAVVCPWHAWAFDLATGECRTSPGARARTYPVRVEGGTVWVEIP